MTDATVAAPTSQEPVADTEPMPEVLSGGSDAQEEGQKGDDNKPLKRDPKAAVFFYLTPVLRFRSALCEAGFTNVRITKTEEPDVWEVRMTRASTPGRLTASSIGKQLRQIAEGANVPIPPGLLVAVTAGRKVLATFEAPAIG